MEILFKKATQGIIRLTTSIIKGETAKNRAKIEKLIESRYHIYISSYDDDDDDDALLLIGREANQI